MNFIDKKTFGSEFKCHCTLNLIIEMTNKYVENYCKEISSRLKVSLTLYLPYDSLTVQQSE